MVASTIQKIKIIQAFDNVLDNYECESVLKKDLNKIFDQVAEIVTSDATEGGLSPEHRVYNRSTIQEQVRASKNQAVAKFLMFRGSL
ncbi:MAG: hypothetical protein HGN29_12615 [Asgard group archaeon]|nr:hypothetical protein [Asgard group archaeon]